MSAVELREAARLMRERANLRHIAEISALLDTAKLGRLTPKGKHMAGTTPAVALAVADLLDDIADIDTIRRPELVADSALAVARAYLAT